MPIIFNVYAFLQALVLATFFGLLYLLNIEGLLNALNISDGWATSLFCYPAFFIVSAMDLRGVKGRLFFLPTWFLLLAAPLVLVSMRQNPAIFGFNVLFSITLFVRFLARLNQQFKFNFEKAQLTLDEMKRIDTTTAEGKKQFWILASHAYFKPGFLFLNSNQLFKFLYRNSVTQKQYILHYQMLLPLLSAEVSNPKYEQKLKEFITAYNNGLFNYEFNMHNKIALIISNEHNKYE